MYKKLHYSITRDNQMNNVANKSTSEVVKQFMKITETSEVFLYGGAAIDRYIDHDAKIMDYDIAIADPAEYAKAINRLRDWGFEVAKPRITHNLSTIAKHPDFGIFDLACMNIENNGIYNLEKFYIQFSADYPSGRAVDKYHTVRALREGRAEIVNNPDNEPAYHLLRRFAVLAGKYNLSLVRNGINKKTIDIIERRLKETPLSKENEHDRVRCLSRFLGAALRAKDTSRYLREIGQTGLLRFAYPEINNLLANDKFTESVDVQKCKTKFDLVRLMFDKTQNKDALIDEIGLLAKREADREEPKLLNEIRLVMSAPASKKRLERLLYPVFAHIQHKGNNNL